MTGTELFWGGFLLSAIGVMGLFSSSRHRTEANPTPVEDSSFGGDQPLPQDFELERLRAINGVRRLEKSQNGFGIGNQPNGVFGFSYAPQEEAPLFHSKTYQSFEMHKLADGSVCVVGFVTEEEAARLESAVEYFDLNLYPDPWQDSARPVSIPLSRILEAKAPARTVGNAMKLRVRSVMRSAAAVN